MIDAPLVAIDVRRPMQLAGIPTSLAYADGAGDYLAAMFAARRSGEKVTVKAAAEMAGLTPSAIRERRRTDPIFAAAERTCRFGESYTVIHEPVPTESEPEVLPPPRNLDEWLERQGVFS
jgi:hypothetical protein